MLVKVKSMSTYGIEPLGIDVEVNVATRGLPSFDIVGLPDKTVAESKERVKTALINSGFEFPQKRITVNLAPADKPKEGAFFDLPIAVGIISIMTNLSLPNNALFYGELSLDGSLRHVRGSLIAALYARENNIKDLYISDECKKEASVINAINVYGVKNLEQLFHHLTEYKMLKKTPAYAMRDEIILESPFDFQDIIGQYHAKRALEIAAAGAHNALMTGVPGSGKTMMAKAFGSILPDLTLEESIEVTKIHTSVGYISPNQGLITNRQIRTPHHTTSYAGLIGGGHFPKPGEISLAHRGVLFLDEFPEFSRYIIESLRQPLEDGVITISRSSGTATYPAKFTLIAASNPCPCGYYGSTNKKCTCTTYQIQKYNKKISGPILDRIDLFTMINAVEVDELSGTKIVNSKEGTSKSIKHRVQLARNRQLKRFKNLNIYTNSEMGNTDIECFCNLDTICLSLLRTAVKKFNMSARSYFKTIKIARTIADLENKENITEKHIAEALQYRHQG